MGYLQDGKIDPEKNCHEYCPYGRSCRYVDGAKGFDWKECAMYYKIDDLMQDARDILDEQRRSAGYECGEDFD